jgi:RNA polymerase primary sigma factor
MKAKIADLSQTLQREPETEEICEALCISAEEYAQLTMMNFQTVSLNTPMGEGEDQTIQDILEDTTTEANAQKTLQNDLLNYIVDCLDSLTPRERMVLTHRYGLDGCFAKTLEEVGEKLSITREGVRQIERKALKKVRTLIQRDHLKI